MTLPPYLIASSLVAYHLSSAANQGPQHPPFARFRGRDGLSVGAQQESCLHFFNDTAETVGDRNAAAYERHDYGFLLFHPVALHILAYSKSPLLLVDSFQLTDC